jgi:cellobiose phosphorylase
MLGMTNDIGEINSITAKYRVIENAKAALLAVKEFWESKLGVLQAETPDPSMNNNA